MHTSNHSRVYWLTPAGQRLAGYLNYVQSAPGVSPDILFADRRVPEPNVPAEDPTEAVKRWIIDHRDSVSMVVANAYIRASRDNWQQAVRWILEYIWHDKMQRRGLEASVISKADWNAITVWITYQTDESLAALAVPEQPEEPQWDDMPKAHQQTPEETAWAIQQLMDAGATFPNFQNVPEQHDEDRDTEDPVIDDGDGFRGWDDGSRPEDFGNDPYDDAEIEED